MLIVQMIDTTTQHSRAIEIPAEQLPSFRAAIQEVRDELADRISARYQYEREASFTKAIIALGIFAGALNTLVPVTDPGFGPRAHLWPEDSGDTTGFRKVEAPAA